MHINLTENSKHNGRLSLSMIKHNFITTLSLIVGALWLQLPLQIRRGYFGKEDLNKKSILHILHLHRDANWSGLQFSPRPINCNVVVAPPLSYCRLWYRHFGLTFNNLLFLAPKRVEDFGQRFLPSVLVAFSQQCNGLISEEINILQPIKKPARNYPLGQPNFFGDFSDKLHHWVWTKLWLHINFWSLRHRFTTTQELQNRPF